MGLGHLQAGRRTNLTLLVLLGVVFATGGLAFGLGKGWARWVVIAHGAVGLSFLAIAPWKSAIARRGLRRRRMKSWASVAFSLLVGTAIGSGIGHATGLLRSIAGLSTMQIHVGAALAAIPFAAWHFAARRVRPRRTDLSRRALLRLAAVVGGSGLFYGAIEGMVRLTSLPGAERRFTGSYATATFDPQEMPVTQWLDDRVPTLNPDSWALTVRAGSVERTWTYQELGEFHDRLRATIDCTGGWFSEQDWEGVLLSHLIPGHVESRSMAVASTTGYARRFPTSDTANLLLATRVGGEPLSAGHGHPVRLVAPGRRGFWWVKWVSSIELSQTPWWWQPPFPLT